MSESGQHVVFGTGQVGFALAARLAGQGIGVRAVSRRRPAALGDGIDWRPADVTNLAEAIDAAEGAAVVYQCLNAPYTKWPELFPPLQRGVLAARNARARCWSRWRTSMPMSRSPFSASGPSAMP